MKNWSQVINNKYFKGESQLRCAVVTKRAL